MDITVSGKQVDLSDALQTHVTQSLGTLSRKMRHTIDAHVTFSRARRFFTCDITLHMRGTQLHGKAEAETAHRAFDMSAYAVAQRMSDTRWRKRDNRRPLNPFAWTLEE